MNQKRYIFLLYCPRFDDYSTRNKRKLCNKLASIKERFDKFVIACVENFSPAPNCTVYESLLGFRSRWSFKQYIPNKPSKYGIKVFVLADSQSSYSYSLISIVYTGKEAHSSQRNTNILVPTKVVLDLVDCISRTNRNITTNNYYTSIPLAKELQKLGLTLVSKQKTKDAYVNCLCKTYEVGATFYGFDHEKNFTSPSTIPKKGTKVVFLSSMHSANSMHEATGKEEINVYYNKTKGGVDSHDQKFSLFITARKTNRWPKRVFYGILDNSIVNVYATLVMNDPNFGGKRNDKRVYFMKELAK